MNLPPRPQLTANTLVAGRYEQQITGADVVDINLHGSVRLDLKALLARR